MGRHKQVFKCQGCGKECRDTYHLEQHKKSCQKFIAAVAEDVTEHAVSSPLQAQEAGPSTTPDEHEYRGSDNLEAHEAGPSTVPDEHDCQSVDFAIPSIDTSKIRKTDENPPRIAVLDLISVMTNQTVSNSSVTFSRLCVYFPEVKDITTYHKFKGRGQKLIPVIPYTNAHIDFILKAIVPGMRIPIARKREILRMQEPLRKYTEIEIHSQIIRALEHFSCVPQYHVGKYRLDLYFPGEKLAVECDENNHTNYNQTEEKERYDTITHQLGCTWIRYDPYNPKFDTFELINQILQNLMVSYTMTT